MKILLPSAIFFTAATAVASDGSLTGYHQKLNGTGRLTCGLFGLVDGLLDLKNCSGLVGSVIAPVDQTIGSLLSTLLSTVTSTIGSLGSVGGGAASPLGDAVGAPAGSASQRAKGLGKADAAGLAGDILKNFRNGLLTELKSLLGGLAGGDCKAYVDDSGRDLEPISDGDDDEHDPIKEIVCGLVDILTGIDAASLVGQTVGSEGDSVLGATCASAGIKLNKILPGIISDVEARLNTTCSRAPAMPKTTKP